VIGFESQLFYGGNSKLDSGNIDLDSERISNGRQGAALPV
jgi:hypothetical protein